LVAAAKSALGVPDVAGITHVLGDAFHYDAGECDLREIDFYEYGEFVAGAFVDVLTGEKVRNIYDYTAPEASESRTALIDILTKKSTFTVKNVYDNRVQERTLGNFSVANSSEAANLFIPSRYTWVDMDRDGAKELIVADSKQAYFLILRYASGKVRGYMMAYRYCYNALYNVDSAAATRINAGCVNELKWDLDHYNQFFSSRKNETATKVADSVNNTYLKVSGDDDGIATYGRVCDYLVNWYLNEYAEEEAAEQQFDPFDETQVDLSGIANAKPAETEPAA
jgi:hypothetical protein